MEIAYYGVNKAYIEQAQDWLAAVDQYPTFNHAGSKVMALTVKSLLKKATVVLLLLSKNEYDLVMANNANSFRNVKLDKIFVVENLDGLKSKLEELFGVKLGVVEEVKEQPVVEKVVDVVVDKPVEVSQSVEKSNKIEDVEPKVSGVSKLAIAELKEEIKALKLERENLEKQLLVGGSVVDTTNTDEELDKLNKQVVELRRQLQVKDGDIANLRESLEDLERDIVLKDKEIRDIKSGVVKKDMIKVPDNVEFYVSASGISLMHAYEYLLTENDEGLIIDLSRESFMDVFVKLNSPIRPDKWLVDGMNIRATCTSYGVKEAYKVSKELTLMTAPAYTLPLSIYDDIDWGLRLKELRKFEFPIMFFLGDISQAGVIEFISRLEGIEVNVLRRDNKLDLRAFNKAKKYIGSVNELVMRGGK